MQLLFVLRISLFRPGRFTASPGPYPGKADAGAGGPFYLSEREDTAATTTPQTNSLDSCRFAPLAASAFKDKDTQAKQSERGGLRDRGGSDVQLDRTDIREIRVWRTGE